MSDSLIGNTDRSI